MQKKKSVKSKKRKNNLENGNNSLAPPRAELRFCVHKSMAGQEKQIDFRGAQTKGSLREGAPDEVG